MHNSKNRLEFEIHQVARTHNKYISNIVNGVDSTQQKWNWLWVWFVVCVSFSIIFVFGFLVRHSTLFPNASEQIQRHVCGAKRVNLRWNDEKFALAWFWCRQIRWPHRRQDRANESWISAFEAHRKRTPIPPAYEVQQCVEISYIKSVATHKCANDNKTPFKQNENENETQKKPNDNNKPKTNNGIYLCTVHYLKYIITCCFYMCQTNVDIYTYIYISKMACC